MNAARITVLAIAIGAGGIAAYLASGSDPQPVAQAPAPKLDTVDVLIAKSDIPLGQTATLELKPDQSETLARSRQSGTLSLALRSLVDAGEPAKPTEERSNRRETVNVVRYGVSTTTQSEK